MTAPEFNTKAAELDVTKQTLATWRYHGTGPAFVRLGPKLVVYRREDVAAWLEANLFVRTDTPAAGGNRG